MVSIYQITGHLPTLVNAKRQQNKGIQGAFTIFTKIFVEGGLYEKKIKKIPKNIFFARATYHRGKSGKFGKDPAQHQQNKDIQHLPKSELTGKSW